MRWNTRSKCIYRFCSRRSANSRSCRWLSLTQPPMKSHRCLTCCGEHRNTMAVGAGAILLALAGAAIAAELGLPVTAAENGAEWLQRPGASFVTLTIQGQLRGCIGTLEAHRALGADVKAIAIAA